MANSQVSYGRQSDIIDQQALAETHITICGLGTVGSNAAVELARMGVGALTLIDDDEVEAHNLPSQAYLLADLGRPKAEALAERVSQVSDHAEVKDEQRRLSGGESFNAGPVILAVDDMDARRDIVELSVASRPTHRLLVDGRMAGKTMQLLAFDPTDKEKVDRWLSDFWFPQEEAHPVACGGRTVSFVGAFAGSMIAALLARSLSGEDVPFFQQADLEHFQLIGGG